MKTVSQTKQYVACCFLYTITMYMYNLSVDCERIYNKMSPYKQTVIPDKSYFLHLEDKLNQSLHLYLPLCS